MSAPTVTLSTIKNIILERLRASPEPIHERDLMATLSKDPRLQEPSGKSNFVRIRQVLREMVLDDIVKSDKKHCYSGDRVLFLE